MTILRNLSELNEWRAQCSGQTIGFVPTMGALHKGHFSLVRESIKQANLTIVSIYVNPTQFDNPEDLRKYPNTLESDIKELKDLEVNAVYLPTPSDLYPNGPISKAFDFGSLARFMEGIGRDGHFEGMATVVTKFFELIQPNFAYFGEKDFQQLAIITRVVQQENLPTVIVPVKTERDEDGMAMSSRNLRLLDAQRKDAGNINKILKKWIFRKGYRSSTPGESSELLANEISHYENLTVHYVTFADSKNLEPIASFNTSTPTRIFVAVQCGNVRLIDNFPLF
ncbi:MAG: pantoate--beta-alanine ligase [Schleiferiaceae bacterium]|jgi:pantoate--beta-alanine ligase|tara:strand:- start:1993 stop:2838 length:846 start_codon:yes stop_codon:yes gene_type:complete